MSLARGLPMEEAIRRAVAVSAANALTESTGNFWQADYEALLPKVEITKC